VEKPSLEVKGSLRGSTWDGHPLTRNGEALGLSASAVQGSWTATIDAPGTVDFRLETTPDRKMKLRLDVASLATYAGLLGIPAGTAFDGKITADAVVTPPAAPGSRAGGEGTLREARLLLAGRKFSLKSPAAFRIADGRVHLEKTTLVEDSAGAPT